MIGNDPYDALMGRRIPQFVRRNPRLRQIVVQLKKRCPVDLSPALAVAPHAMAKTAGSMLTAAARLEDSPSMIAALEALDHADGRLGGGAWGYEFDVQTRWAFYAAGTPNLIATVFVARGFGTAGVVGDSVNLLAQMRASADFLHETLRRRSGAPYFKYTLDSERLVHNANLLGAGLVAMDGALSARPDHIADAVQCAMTSVDKQHIDGSWDYGDGPGLGWSDNFHTAYNLDGLLQVWLASGDPRIRASLDRGVEHWVRNFFGIHGEPRYYAGREYPYDIHSAGTAVDVAARLASWGWETSELAESVAAWTNRVLVNPSTGLTYYQRNRYWTDKRHFVRWGDAHWALGQSSLALHRTGKRDPLETAVADARTVASDAR